MQKSDSIVKLAEALHKAQKSIKSALKDSTNPHFKSKYAGLPSVIEAVKEPLLDNGITFLQGIKGAPNGVAVETMLLHTSGEWISETLEIPATKQDAQGYGSAITYARRYGLQAMCGVPAEDDDGNAATKTYRPLSVASQIWDEQSAEKQNELMKYAEQVIHELEASGGLKAMELLTSFDLDVEEKVALWSRFSSKERAAMEPHKRAKKSA